MGGEPGALDSSHYPLRSSAWTACSALGVQHSTRVLNAFHHSAYLPLCVFLLVLMLPACSGMPCTTKQRPSAPKRFTPDIFYVTSYFDWFLFSARITGLLTPPHPSLLPLPSLRHQTDERTVLVVEDVSSPNVLRFRYGDEVKRKVGNGFFVELQSR